MFSRPPFPYSQFHVGEFEAECLNGLTEEEEEEEEEEEGWKGGSETQSERATDA